MNGFASAATSAQRIACKRHSFGSPGIVASLAVTGGSATPLSGTDPWAKPLSVMKKEPAPDYVAMPSQTDHCGRREMARPPTDTALAQFDTREGQRQQETPG